MDNGTKNREPKCLLMSNVNDVVPGKEAKAASTLCPLLGDRAGWGVIESVK